MLKELDLAGFKVIRIEDFLENGFIYIYTPKVFPLQGVLFIIYRIG
jgi:hypothetical protein